MPKRGSNGNGSKRRAFGEGGLYQRSSDGRWVGTLPASASDSHRKRVVYGWTKAEALAKLDALKQEARRGALVDPARRTMADLFTEFLQSLTVGGATAQTMHTYRKHVRLYLLPALGHLRLVDLRPSHIARLYHALLTGRRPVPDTERGRRHVKPGPLSPTTVALTNQTLHKALALAVRWRYLAHNPADDVDPPKLAVQEAVTLTAEQLTGFLAARAARYDPHLAAWYLAADTGARRAELAALRWDDLHLAGERPSVTIRRSIENTKAGPPRYKEPKTRRGVRTLTISPTTVNALLEHKHRQDAERAADPAWHDYGLLFPAAHGYAAATQRLSGAFKRAAGQEGLPPGLRIHGLRHTMATIALAGGATVDAVSRRLGHASSVITMGVYNHAVRSSEEQAAAIIAGILDHPSRDQQPAATPPAPPVDLGLQRAKRRGTG